MGGDTFAFDVGTLPDDDIIKKVPARLRADPASHFPPSPASLKQAIVVAETTSPGSVVSVASVASSSSLKTLVPAGSVGASKAQGGGVDAFFQCSKCVQACPIAHKQPGRCDCRKCALSYKALCDKKARDRKTTAWWNKKTPEQKIAWYRTQHQLPAGAKRTFDEIIYTQSEEDIKAYIILISLGVLE